MKCALCGFEFAEADARRPCASCPLGAKCNLICCPNCGYQAPQELPWLSRLRRWRRRNERLDGTLAALQSGMEREIISVRPRDQRTLHKLTALGLLPGVRVRLLRRFPCYLIELGHAQIALDRELASAIVVRER
ncbi:MAG: ferrous iron transport protein A [Candidatus Bipolaricaulota bacterium]|nr:ferrous iron transport protein A [Candidatus Bipolaricaulota bacterium]MDW8140775.1 ferrous iron transport protein A [Candidatus Bipolaricaulota bacterium]